MPLCVAAAVATSIGEEQKRSRQQPTVAFGR